MDDDHAARTTGGTAAPAGAGVAKSPAHRWHQRRLFAVLAIDGASVAALALASMPRPTGHRIVNALLAAVTWGCALVFIRSATPRTSTAAAGGCAVTGGAATVGALALANSTGDAGTRALALATAAASAAYTASYVRLLGSLRNS